MDKQTILIFGPSKTGKTTFVKRINGIENNKLPEFTVFPDKFPTIYVIDKKPNNDDMLLFDLVLEFKETSEVVFLKGFQLDSELNSELISKKD